MDEYAKEIDDTLKQMVERRTQLRTLVDDAGKSQLDQFASTWDKYIEVNSEVLRLARLNSNVKAKTLSWNEAREAYEKAASQIGNIVEINEQELERVTEAAALRDAAQKIKLAARINRNLVEIHAVKKI